MKKKVVLVNLRFKVDISFERKESLGIAYIAACLIKDGHEVDLIDAQYHNWDIETVYDLICRKQYDYIGVSLYQETMDSFDKLYSLLGDYAANTHLSIGGHYATFCAEDLLKRYAHIKTVVLGEGELSTTELVNRLHEPDWRKTRGICYLDGNQVVATQRELLCDLDSLPYPYRDPYFLDNESRSEMSVTISASRGCYAHCSFCSIQSFYHQLKGKIIRIRSAKKVVDEMEAVVKEYGIRRFFFADDNFLSTVKIEPSWLDEFISEIEKRDLQCRFDIDCRVNDVDENIFSRLKAIGLNGVFLGIENFNQRVLDTLNKHATVEENKAAIQRLHKMRINVWMGFIMFDMFTTLDEIENNIQELCNINYFRYFNYDRPLSSDWLASPLILYNGTPLLKEMQEEHSDLLSKTEYGYTYRFLSEDTERFYGYLLRWKEKIHKMISLDTLHYINKANHINDLDSAANLHRLSKKYMQIDKDCFVALLQCVKSKQYHLVDDLIQRYDCLLDQVADQIRQVQSIVESGVV